jgi:hypothetical protein
LCWMDIRDKKAAFEKGKLQRVKEQLEHRRTLDSLAARETRAHASPQTMLAVARIPGGQTPPPALPVPSVPTPRLVIAGPAAQVRPASVIIATVRPKIQPSQPKKALRVAKAIPSRTKKAGSRPSKVYATVTPARRSVRPRPAVWTTRMVRGPSPSLRPPALVQSGMRRGFG